MKNKSNYLIFLILLILNLIIILGFSYYGSIREMWVTMTQKDYKFRTYLLYVENQDDADKIIEEIKTHDGVEDVYKSSEKQAYADININDKKGQIGLYGTVANTHKIIYGKDLENDYDLICPVDLYIYGLDYDKSKTLNLKDKINSKITLNYVGKGEEEFNLVGLFDRSYDYSDADDCFTTHNTIGSLNEKYTEDFIMFGQVAESSDNIFVLLSKGTDPSFLSNIEGVYNSGVIAFVNTTLGDRVILITGILSIVMTLFSLTLCFLMYSRKIKKEYKNIGILMLVGYSNKKIKSKKYIENFIINILSSIFSIFISIILLNLYNEFSLSKDASLTLVNATISPLSIIISLVTILIITLISTYFALKKIDNMDPLEVIYE